MGDDHEGLADLDAGAVADGEEGLGLGDGEADGLLAEDVLAGLGGLDGPGDVEVVGKRIVDGVDVGVGEELFVAAVGSGDVEGSGGGFGFCEVARGDGGDRGELSLLHGRDHLLEADGGGAEDAPAKFSWHMEP